jgi:hypothetical protein
VDLQHEVSAHAGAQHLGRPTGGRAGRGEHGANAGCGSRAQDGADVARILDAVKDDEIVAGSGSRQRRPGRLDHGQHR